MSHFDDLEEIGEMFGELSTGIAYHERDNFVVRQYSGIAKQAAATKVTHLAWHHRTKTARAEILTASRVRRWAKAKADPVRLAALRKKKAAWIKESRRKAKAAVSP